MLEFAHKPPRGPEDVSLSETGKVVLESASGWNQVDSLGRAACSELVDSFGESGPPRNAKGNIDIKDSTDMLSQASEVLTDGSMHAFVNGMNFMRLELSLISKVPA
jgi:hypothetical protein